MKKKEAEEQISVFNWIEYNLGKYEDLEFLYHIPNGGFRNSAEAASLKKQGVKPGVPDLCLPVARGGYFGLYIEMKADRSSKASEAQKKWISNLLKQGYQAGVCYGFDDAIRVLKLYLSLPRTEVKMDKEEEKTCELAK